jgi:4-hydroxy-4-methyl-2-oxoglutarate aldolase
MISDDTRRRLAAVQSGVVCDALGRLGLAGFMDGIHPIRREAKLVGRARTIRFAAKRGTALPAISIYSVIRGLAPGDVLVIGTDGAAAWIFGENIANAALHQGLAGIVTDARARDGALLADHVLPAFSSGLATRPPAGIEIVAADVPLSIGGAQVRPNDVIAGDADGIVVVPGDRIDDILVQVEDLAELERLQGEAIARGAPLPELSEILAKKRIRKE